MPHAWSCLLAAWSLSRGTVVRGAQVDPQLVPNGAEFFCGEVVQEVCHQVLLARLSKDHPIDGQGSPEGLEALAITAQRQRGHMTLDLGATGERIDPEGHEIRGPL